MSGEIKSLVLAATIGILVLVCWLILPATSTFDVQLHDTYFVADKPTVMLTAMLPLLVIVFLLTAIVQRFRFITTNLIAACGMFMTAWYAFSFAILLNDMNSAWQRGLPPGALPPSFHYGRYIFFTWAVFVLLLLLSSFLLLKSYQAWRQRRT